MTVELGQITHLYDGDVALCQLHTFSGRLVWHIPNYWKVFSTEDQHGFLQNGYLATYVY